MWESLQYVNNKWALYAIIALSILLFLRSWLNRMKDLVETLPKTDRAAIVKIILYGGYLFQILLLFSAIALVIAIFPILERKMIQPQIPAKECPEKYSDNPNADIDCLFKVK